MKAEVAAAEGRGKAEAEKAALQAALSSAVAQAEAQQATLLLNIQRLETDAKDYKVVSSPCVTTCTGFAQLSMPCSCPHIALSGVIALLA